MSLLLPKERPGLSKKMQKSHQYLIDLINALNDKELPQNFIQETNSQIEEINHLNSNDMQLKKKILKTKKNVSSKMMKELKFVPKGYYQVIWMSIGMTAFGLPVGMALSVAVDNFAFLGTGLPIGFAIGIGIGISLDKKAAGEGKQLDIGMTV